MRNIRVLGLDLSMNCPGFAVMELMNGRAVLLEKSHIKQSTKKTHAQRLQKTAQEIQRYLEDYEIDVVVRERGFSRHNRTTQTLFKVIGVSDYICSLYGKEVVEYSPSEVRKLLFEKGNVGKSTVQDVLARYIGECDYETDDESDATAVAVAYLVKSGLLKKEEC